MMQITLYSKYAVSILLGIPLTWSLYHIWRAINARKVVSDKLKYLFRGPRGHWLLGNMYEHPGVGEEGLKFYRELTAKYEKAFLLWYHGAGAFLNIVHPDTVKDILKTTEPKPVEDGGTYHTLLPWIGDGLLNSSGEKWQRNRRLLTPAFHFDVLLPYMTIYNEATSIFLTKLAKLSERGESVDVFGPVSLLTLNVIMRCAFSYEEDVQQQGSQHPYVQNVKSITEKLIDRTFNPILIHDFFYFKTAAGREMLQQCAHVHQLSESIINSRKAQLSEKPHGADDKKSHDFLDILLLARDESGRGLSDSEIRDEVDTFLFEGHDTTASAISWILYTLAANPEQQATARAEIEELFHGRDSDAMTWEDLSRLPYTTQCIKEAMRLHSPVPCINRILSRPTEIDGKLCPAGTHFDIWLYCIHHNPLVWGEDHMEFRPERFEPDNISKMDSHAFVPFSAGPRNCIGQNFAMHEMKVAISRVLHRFELTVDPEKPPKHEMAAVMRAKDGIHVKFTARN